MDHTATVEELRAAVDGAVPLVWDPVQSRVECPACGFAEESWGIPAVAPCPRCGHDLRPRTTLELAAAPGSMTLQDLGVAPREILAVRGADGLRWIELAGAPPAPVAEPGRSPSEEVSLCR